MAAGSRDRPPMLETGIYAQWQSHFLRYIDTRPNGDSLRKCILEGPYQLTTIIIPAIPATTDSLAVPARTAVEGHILDISHKMWIAIERLQQEWSRFVTIVKEQHDLDTVSYHKLFDVLKQYQKEVNEIRAERITKNSNPLALVAIVQQYPNPYYQAPKSHKPYALTSKQSSSTRSNASTKFKGKEIAKPITPPSESASKEDSDHEQAQRDKDMQKNLALITKTVTVAGDRETVGIQVVQDTGIQCFNFKEFGHFAKECRKKPKKVHNDAEYNDFANVRQHFEQSESTSKTCLVEKDDSNVTPDSPDMCDNDIQTDQNAKDERVALANLIANLKLDCKSILAETSRTLGESNSIRDSSLVALQNKQTKLEKYMAFNDRTIDYDKLKRKLNETLGLLAQKDIDIKEGLKLKAYEISVVQEKRDELVKQGILTKLHYEGLVKEKTKYVESLENEINELESDKAELSNMYDMFLQECVSNDVMCSYLHSLSDLDAHTELQCLYLHKVKECDCLAQKLSKQTEFVKQMKNDTVCKEKASNVFQKEREQYFKIQDLKAQLQDKNIAISELKKLIEKCKGKSVETKFDKPSVVRQPNAQRIPKPSVLGKPAPFSDSLERKNFAKTKSVPKTNVSEGLSKPVTTQNLPQTARKAVRNTNVIKPGMYRIDTRTTQTRAPQLPQTYRNTNPRVSTSTGVIHKTNVSRPQLSSTQMKDKVMPNTCQVKFKKTEVEYHLRISSISNKTKSNCSTHPNVIVDSGCIKHIQCNPNAVVQFCLKRSSCKLFTSNRNHGSDLYTISLQETTSSTSICLMAKASPTQAWLWHERLSHLNFDYINLLSKKDVMICLPKLKYVKDQLFTSCEVSKAKRSSFKTKAIPSSKGWLNLLHMDLCGLMRVASINGKKYILMIQLKSQAPGISVTLLTEMNENKGIMPTEIELTLEQSQQGVSNDVLSQEKNTVIRKLKDRIKSLSGKDNVENVKKDIDEIETINIELEHSVEKLLSENENLRKEREHLKSITKTKFDSIRKTRVQSKEHCDSLIAQINAKSVENSDLNAQLQEMVFAVTTLKNELRKLKGKNVVDTAQTDSLKTKDSNKPLLTSTGVKPTTSASGSKPSGNTKNNRITRPPSSNQKNKVEDHSRKVKSSLNKMNSISEPISNALVKHSMRNAKFKSICAICNKCLFDANHDMCIIDYVNDVNVRSKSKSTRNKMRKVWKPTGEVFTKIGYSWKPTGRNFTIIGNRFGNDHIAKIIGYGDYQMGNVTISRVYYVEGLGYNLFPVGQFCDSDLEVAFRKHTCFIRNLEGVDLLSGSRDINLYTISLDDMLKTSLICLLSKASKTKSWLWHRHLSHLNFGTLNKLAKDGLARGIPKLKFQKDHLCSACALGKSKKSSHQPKAEDTNQEKLYLLHMDLCGPMRVESINGKKYILVIVDDYSRFTWVKFLRSKDEAPDAIIKCIKNIQVRLNATIRNIRTDNGTEFVNQTLRDFYENVGILHQTSVARTPQQNGVVERRNQTLVEAARTISGPGLQVITPATSSSGLVPTIIPQQPCNPPKRDDWDTLFQPLFDEYFNHPTIVVSIVPVVVAPRAIEIADSPVSISIDQDAPSSSIPSIQDQEHSLIISQGVVDLTLFTRKAGNDLLLVQIYVDDIIFASTNTALCNEFSNQMTTKFRMSMMGQIDSVDTPIVEKNKLDEDLQGTPVDATLYRDMIGSLMHLTSSRPDLIYAVCLCARYQAKPIEKHLNAHIQKQITWGVRTLDAVHHEALNS
ncbi:retrovirus-related pol polyprotein from transposon TNT 1-94 [Tanacetum coccineum]|uniref:Retrovirus-related pol polyprotein from transposon TNT 1-94 n=1 Tax=Tanacetum coccineum TaxID=301880 RepID=A0ABQ5DYA1_9ASTR